MAAKKTPDRRWLAKEMQALEMMRLQGMTAEAIAARLRRTLHSVKGRLQLLGIMAPARAMAWVDVLMRRLPDDVAAREMKVAPGTVRTRRSRLRKMGYEFEDGRSLRWKTGAM